MPWLYIWAWNLIYHAVVYDFLLRRKTLRNLGFTSNLKKVWGLLSQKKIEHIDASLCTCSTYVASMEWGTTVSKKENNPVVSQKHQHLRIPKEIRRSGAEIHSHCWYPWQRYGGKPTDETASLQESVSEISMGNSWKFPHAKPRIFLRNRHGSFGFFAMQPLVSAVVWYLLELGAMALWHQWPQKIRKLGKTETPKQSFEGLNC